jgi:hypothetical protein
LLSAPVDPVHDHDQRQVHRIQGEQVHPRKKQLEYTFITVCHAITFS